MSNSHEKALDREEDRLEKAVRSGEISPEEYHAEIRDLEREARALYRERAVDQLRGGREEGWGDGYWGGR